MTSPPDESGSSLVAIDVGQTGTRAAIVAAGVRTTRRFGYRARPEADGPQDVVGVRAVAEELAAAAAEPSTVAVSLSGFDPRRDYGELSRAIATPLRCPVVQVAWDAAAGLAGSIGAAAGVCVTWGTGVVALASDGAGGWWRVDGRGFLLGDAGGGGWVGRRGIRAGLDHLEGRGGSAALAAAVLSRFGSPEALHDQVYGSRPPASLFAAFAPEVLHAAATGDGAATLVVAAAAAEVAHSVVAAASHLGAAPDLRVALTGGMAAPGSPQVATLRRLLEMSLPAATTVDVFPDAPLEGALRIAGGDYAPALIEGLVHTWRREP